MSAHTLDIIASVVALRDKTPAGDTVARTILADAASELSGLNALRDEMLGALQYGLELYGFNGVQGYWPVEMRLEFDRLASAAAARAKGSPS